MPGKKKSVTDKGKEKLVLSEPATQYQAHQASFKNTDPSELAGKRICYGVSTNKGNENHNGPNLQRTKNLLNSIEYETLTYFVADELQYLTKFIEEILKGNPMPFEEKARQLAREDGDAWIKANLNTSNTILRWNDLDNNSNDAQAKIFKTALEQTYFWFLLGELKVEDDTSTSLTNITATKLSTILLEINALEQIDETSVSKVLSDHHIIIGNFNFNILNPNKFLNNLIVDKSKHAIDILIKLAEIDIPHRDIISLDMLPSNAAELISKGNYIINFIAGLRTLRYLQNYLEEDKELNYRNCSKDLSKQEKFLNKQKNMLSEKKAKIANDLVAIQNCIEETTKYISKLKELIKCKEFQCNSDNLELTLKVKDDKAELKQAKEKLKSQEKESESIRSNLAVIQARLIDCNNELSTLNNTLTDFKNTLSPKLAAFPFSPILQYSRNFTLNDIAMMIAIAATRNYDCLVYPLRQDDDHRKLFDLIRKMLNKYPDFELIDILLPKTPSKIEEKTASTVEDAIVSNDAIITSTPIQQTLVDEQVISISMIAEKSTDGSDLTTEHQPIPRSYEEEEQVNPIIMITTPASNNDSHVAVSTASLLGKSLSDTLTPKPEMFQIVRRKANKFIDFSELSHELNQLVQVCEGVYKATEVVETLLTVVLEELQKGGLPTEGLQDASEKPLSPRKNFTNKANKAYG